MPVDIGSGVVWSTNRDIAIPGKVKLTWERRYSTALLNGASSALGPGWTTRYYSTLTRHKDAYHFITPEGNLVVFADPEGCVERGEVVRNLGRYHELSRRSHYYIITQWDVDTGVVERYTFRQGSFGQAWPLASIEDITGQGLDLKYDRAGRLVGIEQRLEKRTLRLEYTTGNRISTVVFEPLSGQSHVLARYNYDERGRMQAAYNALDHANRYEYDEQSRMVREHIKDGGIFFFKYDDQGRCIRTSGLDNYDLKALRYLDTVGWTEVTNSLGHTTRYEKLPSGQIVREIDSLGGVKETEYDEHGRISSKTNPIGATTKYTYDEYGNRCKIVDALGNETSYVFNAEHLPIMLTDPAGGVWKRKYDDSNRLAIAEDPMGGCWSYVYDYWGSIIRVLNPNGVETQLRFSKNGILEEIIDWEGVSTKYTVDAMGRIVERIGQGGEYARYSYDLLGNLLEYQKANGSRISYGYDAGNNRISVKNEKGYLFKYRFGPCRRLQEKIDRLGNVTTYIWGTEPTRLEKILNPKGDIFEFNYDAAGRLVGEKEFGGRELKYIRDVAGRSKTIVNAQGEHIELIRDLAGRLIERHLTDGTTTTFQYDNLGQLSAADTADCGLRFERDPLGRVVKEIQGDYQLDYAYDRAGNLLEIKTSSGHIVHYTRNARDVLSNVAVNDHPVVQFRHKHYNTIERLLPGDLVLSHHVESTNRSLKQRLLRAHAQGNGRGNSSDRNGDMTLASDVFISRDYRFEESGVLASVEDRRDGILQYSFDPSERVVHISKDRVEHEVYAYDTTGNITRRRSQGEEEVLTYGPGDVLLRRGNTQYIYDIDGRLIQKLENEGTGDLREWKYTWDALDQLRTVETPTGIVWRYGYDALGRRVSKENINKKVEFLWDRNVVLQQVEDGIEVSKWVYSPYGFAPLCTMQGGSIFSVIPDHIGTPREVVDSAGRIVWSANYTLWGEVEQITEQKIDCPIRFPGQWYDEETGLHYNRFRYYDPQNGRYITRDPLGLRGGPNLYTYARNPLNWVDPYGLATVFRGMHKDADGQPVVHSHTDGTGHNPANSLGVREADQGAMSSAYDPGHIQDHRKPTDFGGTQGRSETSAPHGAGMFAIDDTVLEQHGLRAVQDSDTHVSVVPAEGKGQISDADLAERLSATRDEWREVNPEEAERLAQQNQGSCGE